MAFSKPIKVTTIKEYGTNAPDSVYPKTPEFATNNNPQDNAFIGTGDLDKSNYQRPSPESPAKITGATYPTGWGHHIQTIAAILAILATLGGFVWYLSKVDSSIDEIKKNLKTHESKIEQLKEGLAKAFFKVENLEQNNSSKNTAPEPKKNLAPEKKSPLK